jgi:hypothetical protein
MILGDVGNNDHHIQSGWCVTNGIRADQRDFTYAYESVEKDTVANGSGIWVHTHDLWVLREGHSMVHIMLTGRTLCICQDVWTWTSKDVPGLRFANGDIGLLREVDCDILAQSLIGLIEY